MAYSIVSSSVLFQFTAKDRLVFVNFSVNFNNSVGLIMYSFNLYIFNNKNNNNNGEFCSYYRVWQISGFSGGIPNFSHIR